MQEAPNFTPQLDDAGWLDGITQHIPAWSTASALVLPSLLLQLSSAHRGWQDPWSPLARLGLLTGPNPEPWMGAEPALGGGSSRVNVVCMEM